MFYFFSTHHRTCNTFVIKFGYYCSLVLESCVHYLNFLSLSYSCETQGDYYPNVKGLWWEVSEIIMFKFWCSFFHYSHQCIYWRTSLKTDTQPFYRYLIFIYFHVLNLTGIFLKRESLKSLCIPQRSPAILLQYVYIISVNLYRLYPYSCNVIFSSNILVCVCYFVAQEDWEDFPRK